MYGNQLTLFWAKTFSLLKLFISLTVQEALLTSLVITRCRAKIPDSVVKGGKRTIFGNFSFDIIKMS